MGSCFSKEAPSPPKAPPQTQSSRVQNIQTKETGVSQPPPTAQIKPNYSLNSANNNNDNQKNNQNNSNNNNNNNNNSSDASATSPLSGSVKSFSQKEVANLNSNGSKVNGNAQPNTSNDGSRPKVPNGLPNGNGMINEDTGNRPEVKILLLGSGESGKSTILKQMKIIHQNGYSQEEMLMYKTTVYKNLLDCAKAIVNALEKFHIDLETISASDIISPAPVTTTKMIDNLDDDDEPHSNDTRGSHSEDGSSNDDTTNHSNASLVEPEQIVIPHITKEELAYIKNSIISPDPDSTLDPELTTIIAKLWSHPVVKNLYATKRSRFYIMDSAPYFFNNVERIGDVDYIPNVQDILRARIKTTGIYEIRFQMGRLNIHMYDLGGQRSERKKWIHCFDDVTVIIFCVALSEYDQVLLEENTQNRMAESLVLFDSVINSRWFVRTSIVLFLNKIDVFTEKLPVSPLENYFPDYTGGNNIKKAAKYILWRFTQLNRNKLSIYPHITQATDTSNIKLVFAAIKATILQNSLKDSGLI